MALFQNASKALRKWGPAALTTFFMAANANAADTNVPIELTCYTKPEDIAAVKKTITEDLGMIATTSHFTNAGTNDTPIWAMATLMRNPKTRKGYEWIRREDGHVCISKSYSNIELYLNTQLNSKAFLDKKSAPKADNVGNGKDISKSGINAALIASAQNGQFAMYRGNVDDIIGSRISGVAQSRSPPGQNSAGTDTRIRYLGCPGEMGWPDAYSQKSLRKARTPQTQMKTGAIAPEINTELCIRQPSASDAVHLFQQVRDSTELKKQAQELVLRELQQTHSRPYHRTHSNHG